MDSVALMSPQLCVFLSAKPLRANVNLSAPKVHSGSEQQQQLGEAELDFSALCDPQVGPQLIHYT